MTRFILQKIRGLGAPPQTGLLTRTAAAFRPLLGIPGAPEPGCQLGDVADVMDDELNLAVIVQDRTIDRVPVTLYERPAAIANVVALPEHFVVLFSGQHIMQRRAEIADPICGRVAGIVGKYIEYAAPNDDLRVGQS